MAAYQKQSWSIRENYGHFYDFCFDSRLLNMDVRETDCLEKLGVN